MIRREVIVILLAALISVSTYAQEPVFQLKDLDNQWVTYQDLKGQHLTVIDFWATWCQPCLRSIPEFNRLFAEFNSLGVNFIGISIDGPRNQAKLKPFVNSLGIEYTILRDINSEVMNDMNVTSVPTLLILDTTGNVIFIHEGYRPGDEELIRDSIEKHL